MIDTNVTGTLLLVQGIARQMVARSSGKILITGSIAGHIAGSFQAVYSASKAFIDSFSDAVENQLKDTEITVTCLKPGSTETEFLEHADLTDIKVRQAKKDDPADVAGTGWDAMNDGKRSAVHGWMNQAHVAAMKIAGGGVAAEMHRKQTEPGSAR